MTSVFQNPNAAYLSTGVSDVPSPLNIGIENSRRFRALPVYAVLLSHGSFGLAEMFARQVRLARGVAEFLDGHEKYELLAQPSDASSSNKYGKTHIIVLFRARDEQRNSELVNKINGTRTIYVSGTKWEDKPACRIAVSTWKVDVQRDLKLITEILSGALE
jgi:glutamate/tyrosine decarboxylase-like PLP-dependent enzyme